MCVALAHLQVLLVKRGTFLKYLFECLSSKPLFSRPLVILLIVARASGHFSGGGHEKKLVKVSSAPITLRFIVRMLVSFKHDRFLN